MIVCKEVLQAAGPVNATGQKTKHTLLAAHVAVPRVLLDCRVCCPLADEEVDTFHTKAPTQERDTSPTVRFFWHARASFCNLLGARQVI